MASHLIDDVAKALAGGMNRRQALKFITAGLSAAIMGSLAFGDTKCKKGEEKCGPNCCPHNWDCIDNKKCCQHDHTCGNDCCGPNEKCETRRGKRPRCVPVSPSPS
jgi:hypothetical protein